MKTAILAGATGLIGNQLLKLLLDDDHYATVKVISRKPLVQAHPKLEVIHTDFDRMENIGDQLKGDDVFCCLGTTIKIAKTKEAFKRVDHDYPLMLARLTKQQGATQYTLVSALGADATSSVFYNKVKGQVEDAIREISFDALHIYRPSLLLGNRPEERSGEDAAKLFFKFFGFLVPRKYKAIDSIKVARAMIAFAKENQKGLRIHESASLQEF